MAIIAATNMTNTFVTLILGVYLNTKLQLLYGDLVTRTNSTIYDDASFGPIPSSNNSLHTDLLFTDIRYDVLTKGCLAYLNMYAQQQSANSNVIAFVTSKGTKSLCSTLYMPIIINRGTNNPQIQMQNFKNAIASELNKAKITYSYMGNTFLEQLDSHINWLMIILDMVYANPLAAVTQAYSNPDWGTTGAMAANSCMLTMNNLKR